jgi:predicted branched-subunit amino acid permease
MTTSAVSAATAQQRAALAGAADMAPALAGLAPLGIAIGATAAAAPVPDAVGWASGPLLFSGAAQLSVIQLLGSGTAPVAVVLSVLVLNARFILYGAALAPMLSAQPAWFRWLAPYFVVDPLVATVSARDGEAHSADWRRAHYLGAATSLWALWGTSIAAGVAAGPVVDDAWALDFAGPLFLLAMLAARLKSERGARVATPVAASVAALALVVPAGLAVVVAMLAGTVAASLLDRRAR